VTDLHARLMHAASPDVMKRAIRDCAWPGVPILPDAVDHVYLHQDCVRGHRSPVAQQLQV
jgi:hypothetical protein